MSYDYKSRLDDYLSGDPTKKNESKKDENIIYFDDNYTGVRNLCFVLLDGKQIFLNYNYLVAGEFIPEDNIITLSFTTHSVVLNGHALERLYFELMQHLPKIITATNPRYAGIAQGNMPVVTGIGVKDK